MAAPELQIRGGDGVVKLRSPVRSALLDVVTIGIYGFYWYYAVNKELAALGRARGSTERLGDDPRKSFLALLPGILLLVPFLISGYNTAERVRAAQHGSGAGESINSAVAAVTMLVFFPVAIFYVQGELNKVWAREAEGGATRAEQPAPA